MSHVADPDTTSTSTSTVDARRVFTVSITIGVVLSFVVVAAGVLALGEGWGAALGLGAFVGFWGGLGFGAMVGGVTWATRAEAS